MDESVVSARWPRNLSYGLAVVVVALWVLGGVLLFADRFVVYGNDWTLWGLFMLTGTAYLGSAVAIVRRQPSNPVGWLMLGIAALLAAGTPMTDYGIYAIRVSPGSLPAPGLVLALAEPTPFLSVAGIALVLLLFPNGRPVSRWWRPVVWATVILAVMNAVGTILTPHRIVDIWSDSLSHAHVSVADPLGVRALSILNASVGQVMFPLVVLAFVLGVVSLFVRRRRADPVQRAQLRWLNLVVGSAVVWIAVMIPVAAIIGFNGWAGSLIWLVVTPLVALGIPVAVGIGIVRYRLFAIDVVISKTIVYGTLAAFITIVYIGIVVGVGQVAGSVGAPALSAVAAAVVAIAFQPVRRRVQRFANRLVYGDRATPYEVLSEFSERVAGAYAIEDLSKRIARILAEGTSAKGTAVMLRIGAELRPDAWWPEDLPPPEAMAVADAQGQVSDDEHLLAVVQHQGEVLGALSVTKPPGDPITSTERKLANDLAAQAGLVLRNVRLTEELRANLEELHASRQRLVAAQDEERRRLERNLHDGAQQELVALAVKLRLARQLADRDVARTKEMLGQLQDDATSALENLRDLARGIYPPLLADRGLAAALEAQARKAPVPTAVHAQQVDRYPQDVEAATYFCCLEALQNIAKYAHATHVDIDLGSDDGTLMFRITDDGAGFDPAVTARGAGLQNMTDRLASLDGDLHIDSAPGRGTTIEGRLPVAVGQFDP
jgi:signal transduction histidine kinase